MTPLDQAHAVMAERPDDLSARLRFFGKLAETELIVLVKGETGTDALTPQQFDLEDGPVVLAFDTEDRLTDFTGAPSAYAAMPGRVVAVQLAGQGVGLGVNLGVAPSSILLPPDALDWLAETVSSAADQVMSRRPHTFLPPTDCPITIIAALGDVLRRVGGMADHALFALADTGQGAGQPILAVIGADDARHDALARMISETVAFAGQPDWMPDVVFLKEGDPALPALAEVAHRFEMPAPHEGSVAAQPAAPGTDPNRPPILR